MAILKILKKSLKYIGVTAMVAAYPTAIILGMWGAHTLIQSWDPIPDDIPDAIEEPIHTPPLPTPVPTPEPSDQEPRPIIKRKINPDLHVIQLHTNNTLQLRGPITPDSVNDLIIKVLKLSEKLSPNDVIYLVLDTPGGYIDAGKHLLDVLQVLPQRVDTITMFAASMGFHTVQNLNNRYITPSGTLMSHRASIGGLSGHVPGEAVTRLQMIIDEVRALEQRTADGIGITLEDYQRLHWNEYWVGGQKAVDSHMADKVVRIRCSRWLINERYTQEIEATFAKVKVTWSGCPLIRQPIKVEGSRSHPFIELMLTDPSTFVKKYIVTGEFYNYLRK